jgi:outer membrane immunogenic protein
LGTAIAFAVPAIAADPARVRVAPIPVPAFTWTGFYIGANGGWGEFTESVRADSYQINQLTNIFAPGFGVVVIPSTVRPVVGLRAKESGLIGGGQVGFNWQVDRVVFGLEADLDTG